MGLPSEFTALHLEIYSVVRWTGRAVIYAVGAALDKSYDAFMLSTSRTAR